ncbi:MAG: hypothetical protein ACPGJO_07995 [bacterium]
MPQLPPSSEMCRELISRYKRHAAEAQTATSRKHFRYWVKFWQTKLKQAVRREGKQ